MKILMISNHLGVQSGVQRYVQNLLLNLDLTRYQVDLFVGLCPPDQASCAPALEAAGVHIIAVPDNKKARIRALYQHLKTHKDYDIIHYHTASKIGAPVCGMMRVLCPHAKIIVHSHIVYPPMTLTWRAAHLVYQLFADYFLGCGVAAGRFVFGDHIDAKPNFSVACNAVDAGRFHPDAAARAAAVHRHEQHTDAAQHDRVEDDLQPGHAGLDGHVVEDHRGVGVGLIVGVHKLGDLTGVEVATVGQLIADVDGSAVGGQFVVIVLATAEVGQQAARRQICRGGRILRQGHLALFKPHLQEVGVAVQPVRGYLLILEIIVDVRVIDMLGSRSRHQRRETYEKQYHYHEHGNLNVPSEYVTPDGVLLGKWVARQRYAYLNPDRSSARVTPERKALLDKLGMVWEKYDPWQERYDLALAYKTEHGDLEIPSVYKTADGVWLGSWVSRQRQALNSGSSALSSERRKLLRILFKGERRPSDPAADHGTVREANWERNFRSAARYARKYKHLLVPASYVDSDGVRLGVWISNLRAARKNRPDSYQVTLAHIKKLNSIGMVWDARDAKWGTAYKQAKAYYKAHGNLHAAANYKSDETGFCLGDWLRRMREWDTTHDPKLTPERRAMLDKIGMEWSE